MAFDAYGTGKTSGGSKSNVDWDAYQRSVVEQANLEERETLVGVVSSIIDLGIQAQPDSEVVFGGNAEEEAKIEAEFEGTYFKDGVDPQTKKKVRLKCWPNKPIQSVTLAIDFPDIMIDRSAFFKDAEPRPLRIYMGGKFYIPGVGMVCARTIPFKLNKKLGDWSLAQTNVLHKMAKDSKVIKKPDDCFLPQNIDKLLGKAFQFEAQVFMKPGNNGKEFFTDYVRYVGALGRGQATPELDVTPVMIQFNSDNDPDGVKELGSHIVNTIRQAQNFEGSKISKQLEEIRGASNKSSDEKEDEGEDTPQKEAPAKEAPKRERKKTEPKPKEEAPEAEGEEFDSEVPW